MANLRTGEHVFIVCQGKRVEATVMLVSENGTPLMLGFDAILDGHLGMMPVLRDEDGVYRSVLTGIDITIEGGH